MYTLHYMIIKVKKKKDFFKGLKFGTN